MSPATDNNANKRVRIDGENREIGADNGTMTDAAARLQAPIRAAERVIKFHLESLQPNLATILEKLSLDFVRLLAKAYNKEKQISRMANEDDLIPRSARVAFEFNVSNKAEKSPAFIQLKTETATLIDQFQRNLKAKIVEVTTLELSILRDDITEEFVKNIRFITQVFITNDGLRPSDVDLIVNTLLSRYHLVLLAYLNVDATEFRQKYRTFHALTDLPYPLRAELEDASTQTPESIQRHADNNRLISVLYRTLEALFVRSWAAYIDTSKQNDINLALKKLSTEHYTSHSTADAIMELDAEPPADRTQLNALIAEQVRQETTKIQNELQKTRQQVAALKQSSKTTAPNRSKNVKRGSSSASSNKKGPVADNANATSAAASNLTI